MNREIVLKAKNLKKYFPVGRSFFHGSKEKQQYVKAVNGVDFEIAKGEILGIAGESGSGKSTTGELIVRLIEPTSGSLTLDGNEIAHIAKKNLKTFRNKVQMIFQDPFGTLNPRFSIYKTIEEPLIINGFKDASEREKLVKRALLMAELNPPEKYMHRLPHELSGGERQRISIARAVVLDPEVLVADEPVSMLDVSIRASVLNLLKNLRDKLDLAMIYISHDLSTIRYLCDRTAIMYLGEIIEIGPTSEVMDNPVHPYTKLLLSSVPIADPDYRREEAESYDDLPDQIKMEDGCKFYPRCIDRQDACKEFKPEHFDLGNRHTASCILCRMQE